VPALESAHAIAHVRKLAPQLGRGAVLVANLSGRGDKDAPLVRELLAARRAAGH
jgi:tryptophan synthase beta subunit